MANIRKCLMNNTSFGHNKFYYVYLEYEEIQKRFIVFAKSGAINGAQTMREKGTYPLLPVAEQIYDKLVQSKIRKGYNIFYKKTIDPDTGEILNKYDPDNKEKSFMIIKKEEEPFDISVLNRIKELKERNKT